MEWGLEQTRDSMDRCGTTKSHPCLFESGESVPRDENQFRRAEANNGAPVVIRGS